MWVSGRASARPAVGGIVARVPTLRNTRSPLSTRVPPPSRKRTSSVFGATNRPSPMISSAPLCRYRSRCTAIRPSTISRLRWRTLAMSTATEPVTIPNRAAWCSRSATLALQISFLLGRQLMFGHDPPIQRRSTTATRRPERARCQASFLPPSPLPSTTSSYGCGSDMCISLNGDRPAPGADGLQERALSLDPAGGAVPTPAEEGSLLPAHGKKGSPTAERPTWVGRGRFGGGGSVQRNRQRLDGGAAIETYLT